MQRNGQAVRPPGRVYVMEAAEATEAEPEAEASGGMETGNVSTKADLYFSPLFRVITSRILS